MKHELKLHNITAKQWHSEFNAIYSEILHYELLSKDALETYLLKNGRTLASLRAVIIDKMMFYRKFSWEADKSVKDWTLGDNAPSNQQVEYSYINKTKEIEEMELTKEYLIEQLGAFEDFENMPTAGGKKAPNHLKLYYKNGVFLKSYNSIIAIKFLNTVEDERLKGKVVLGCYYDYSSTTGKYRNAFLQESLKYTRHQLEVGTHLYCEDLK